MISISWSLLNQYTICPLRVKYELDNTPHPISWALAIGDITHKALGAWARDEDWRDVFEQRYQQYVHRTVPGQKLWNGEFQGQQDGVIQRAMALNLLDEYTSTVKGRPLKDSVELQLSKDLGDGVILTGRIDAIWDDGTIVDWKAASGPKYLPVVQAIIYTILTGGPNKFQFHGLFKTRVPYCDFISVVETEKQENLDRVVEYHVKPIAALIEQGVFPSKPGEFLCQEQYCGYWKICEGRLV